MSEHLIINPNKLYILYSPNSMVEYYNYDFLPTYTSIENDIIYDILNSLNTKELFNLHKYLYRQWELTKKDIELNKCNNKSNNNNILSRNIIHKISSKDEFNNILSLFINNDKVLGLYIINKIIKFLYPC